MIPLVHYFSMGAAHFHWLHRVLTQGLDSGKSLRYNLIYLIHDVAIRFERETQCLVLGIGKTHSPDLPGAASTDQDLAVDLIRPLEGKHGIWHAVLALGREDR